MLIWAAWGIVVSHPGVGSTLIAAGLLSAAITVAIAWNLRSRRPALVQPSASWERNVPEGTCTVDR